MNWTNVILTIYNEFYLKIQKHLASPVSLNIFTYIKLLSCVLFASSEPRHHYRLDPVAQLRNSPHSPPHVHDSSLAEPIIQVKATNVRSARNTSANENSKHAMLLKVSGLEDFGACIENVAFV